MAEHTTIETYEGHDVTAAAMDCNIGSGLKQAAKINPARYEVGEIIDIIVRSRVVKVAHKPSIADDFQGPYTRIHVLQPLGATPVQNATVSALLDKHMTKVQQFREIPGQKSIDDEIANLDTERKPRRAKKSTEPRKRRVPAMPKTVATAELGTGE